MSCLSPHVLDVFLQLIGVRSAVQEDILHTGIGEELKRIFNQGSVRKRQETLDQSFCVSFRIPPPSLHPVNAATQSHIPWASQV